VPLDPADRATVAGWTAAEDALYGPLLADPQGYERVVALVGAVVTHLRATVHDVADLVAASQQGPALVAELEPEGALPWLPLDSVVGAACAMRHRELLSIEQQEKRTQMLADARRSGDPWVRIVDATASVAPVVAPAVVVHVPSGMAIRCTTEMDVETGGARFVSSPVTLDLGRGDVIGPLDGVGGERWSTTVAGRDAQVAEIQRAIEALDSQRHVG
jgi:hypothetical protein